MGEEAHLETAYLRPSLSTEGGWRLWGKRSAVTWGSTDYEGLHIALGDPPHSLLLEADTFCALVALSWNGRRFRGPTLFTLTSQDGAPLTTSARVRVFHGSGDDLIPWRGRQLTIRREAVV